MMLCVVGGATVAQHAWPKTEDVMAGLPAEASRGLSKFAWFRALKASARNCSFTRSVTLKRLTALRSRFQYGAARKMLRPAPLDPGAGKTNTVCAKAGSNTTGP